MAPRRSLVWLSQVGVTTVGTLIFHHRKWSNYSFWGPTTLNCQLQYLTSMQYFAGEQYFMHLEEKKTAQIVDLFAGLGGGVAGAPLAPPSRYGPELDTF